MLQLLLHDIRCKSSFTGNAKRCLATMGVKFSLILFLDILLTQKYKLDF